MERKADPTAAKAKPRRRWFRFRLRTLLILSMLLGSAAGSVREAIWTVKTRHKMLEATDQARKKALKMGDDPWDSPP
jgi:hypothetical protein